MPDKEDLPTFDEWLKDHPTDGSKEAIDEQVSDWLNELTHIKIVRSNLRKEDIEKFCEPVTFESTHDDGSVYTIEPLPDDKLLKIPSRMIGEPKDKDDSPNRP